jgi:hypothetical protein
MVDGRTLEIRNVLAANIAGADRNRFELDLDGRRGNLVQLPCEDLQT